MRASVSRTSTTKELESQKFGLLSKGPWTLVIVTSGWFLWGYFHLRPAALVTSAGRPGAAYGPWAWGHLAYSDVVSLYYAFHLANHAVPFVDTRVEYPVLIGIFMWLAAWAPDGVQGYFAASSLGLFVCALGTLCYLSRIDRRLAWSFALCPLLLVYGLLNWDLLAIFFMVAGWAQFRARRYPSAGVLLSLGVWAKFFPVILLLFCVASLLGKRADRVHARTMALWAGAVALLVNLPFAVTNVGNWGHFFVFNVRRGGASGVLYELHLASALSIPAVDVLSGVLVLLVVALLVPRVLKGDSPVAAAAVVFGVLLLVNKVYSPQYMLWLVVFALLAEWPVWTVALMSMAGLVDYADAMTALYLSHTQSPALSWFLHTLYPWNAVQRTASIALTLVGGWAKCGRAAMVPVGDCGRSRWSERPAEVLPLDGPDEFGRPNAAPATGPDGARDVDRPFPPD